MDQRYARQTILPEIGLAGQKRLSEARVLCIGAGGLGSPTLLYLAAAGVGTIGIVDDDAVSLSNLQRQILFTTDNVGQSKSELARQRLLELNPEIKVNVHSERFTAINAESLLADYDLLVDGSDNFATKFLANDACVKSAKPLVSASILRHEGQLSVFDARRGPCYRCLYSAPPEFAQNCAEAGVFGAIAGILGSMQAYEVIKLIVGHPDLKPLIGKIVVVDGSDMSFSNFSLGRKADCPICSIAREGIVLSGGIDGCASDSAMSDADQAITAEDLRRLISQNEQFRLVDIREQNELEIGMIPSAEHWAYSKIQQGDLPRKSDLPTIYYCQSGGRTRTALKILVQNGHKNSRYLLGGFNSF